VNVPPNKSQEKEMISVIEIITKATEILKGKIVAFFEKIFFDFKSPGKNQSNRVSKSIRVL